MPKGSEQAGGKIADQHNQEGREVHNQAMYCFAY